MNREEIVTALKDERDRIDEALIALGGKKGVVNASGRRSYGITAAGRKRLSDLMKKRWADRRKGPRLLRKGA